MPSRYVPGAASEERAMYPGHWATVKPDEPATIMARSGEVVTWRQLDDDSNRLANFWWEAGLRPGDGVTLFAENRAEYLTVTWAAMRSGLYLTAVNRYLTAEEAAYIVNDCGAGVLVASSELAPSAELPALLDDCPIRLSFGVIEGFQAYDEALAGSSPEPRPEQPRGEFMLYSSGTTGRPKGIRRPLSGLPITEPTSLVPLMVGLLGADEHGVYLSPAPQYHSAPLAYSFSMQSVGSPVVVMERFDPEEALQLIERFGVTHSQWVPTMFIRMLKLPDDVRGRYDLSTHRKAVHAAAPCPVEVKRQMIEWWGPVLEEYYAGTEANGATWITSEQWLEHPGSVGRPILGTIHICDDEGAELPPGEPGLIYFELEEMPFEYHNDPAKTASAQHPEHRNWSRLGDVGYVDEEGWLFLTDRKDFMIISGGVNIYPQEIEDAFVLHPMVADVAVFGIPNEDFGEEVKAAVQLVEGIEPSVEVERELIEFAREHVAHYKVPRSIDFEAELPRLPTGKLYKRLLRDKYWGKKDSRIV
jgi:acyl-CoA synthetase (AMP-forming)/AMP-acid ligase II